MSTVFAGRFAQKNRKNAGAKKNNKKDARQGQDARFVEIRFSVVISCEFSFIFKMSFCSFLTLV